MWDPETCKGAKDQRIALKELRGLEDEVILPADKGNTTVMMRRCN